MTGDPQVQEFDLVAAWTAEVVADVEPHVALAAACRGSGSPAALAWLAESLELSDGTWLLDVGSGLGGPASWAGDRYGARPIGAEPMEGAARGAMGLFDPPTVVALADALPFASRSFEAAWTLGVLDTVDDPELLLAEVHRCLVPGGRFGILAYVAEQPIADDDLPEGNRFPTGKDLLGSLEAADFVVVEHIDLAGIPSIPAGWRDHQDAVDDELQRRHGRDERWVAAQENEERFASLLDDGRVEAVLVHARRR